LEEGKIFTRDPIKLSAIENLQKVLNTLNWLFYKANVQVELITSNSVKNGFE